jgi:hypothetical protein
MTSPFSFIGKRLPRSDALEKVTGEARFLSDLRFPGMLHGKILRSPLPHAKILRIDTSKADRLPGVKAVITADDTPGIKFSSVRELADKLPLAREKVRFIGDEVAAVAAADPEVAEEGLRELVTQVRETTQKTLIVKLNAMVPDIRVFAEICQKCQADGLSLINGLPGMAIDIETRRSKLGKNVTGGLTGPAVKPFALYMVWQVCKAVRIPVIGIGGISSTEDAIEFLIAGASAVQIGTMNFVNPTIMAEVIDGIKGYLVQNKMETVSELIGSLS